MDDYVDPRTIDQIIETLVEVTLPTEDDFLKVKETLTRIGVANRKNELYQSCHILQKRGKFYIVHFKELFILDGKPSTLTQEDVGRRNTIINLLAEWGLVKVVNSEKIAENVVPLNKIKIIAFKDKNSWTLVQKYQLGHKRH